MARKSRSTGCRVCVRRRVKCDETRPSCQRCIKARLECSGFAPPIQWVDQTGEPTPDRLGFESSDASRSVTPQSPAALGRWRRTPTASPHSAAGDGTSLTRGLKDSPNSVFFSYLLSQFFATGRWCDYDGNHTWITTCLTKEEEHPTSKLATESLAKAYFGRHHGLPDVINDGSRTYGKALLALCEDLKDAEKSLSYDTLAATVALSLYEHLMFTTRQGWVQHGQGVAHLIEMRGPEKFLKNPDRAIFDMNRNILTIQALVNRKKTFLEQDRWIEVAWPEPTPRPPIVRLQDIFTKLPGMTEDILKLASDSTIRADALRAAQRKMNQIVDDLRVLELEMLVNESLAEEDPPSSTSPGDPFDTDIKYRSLIAASTWITFDTIFILALEWQYKSCHLEWQKGDNHEGYELIPEIQQYALHICRSVEYLLQPQWMHSGAFYLLLPARVAFYALPLSSPEALRLVGILERIAITTGVEMARNVLTNVHVNEKRPNVLSDYQAMLTRALPAPSTVS